MKKLLALILSASMLFSFAACGGSSESKDDDSDKKNSSDIVENNGGVAEENNGFDADKDDSNADFSDTQVGDYITFGSYEQDNDLSNGKEPIEWFVLDKKDGKILVISKYGLDCQDFNETRAEVTWETCTLRDWLNNEFINEAFTQNEKAQIPTVAVTADADPNHKLDIDMGNDTQDRVFVLSVVELNEYFDSESERVCKITRYTESKGASGYWWLRTLCHYDSAYCIDIDGTTDFGAPHNAGNIAVRPAMWIEL